MSGPSHHVLPPATTTNVDLRSQAAGFFAQRRQGASVSEAAPRKTTKAPKAVQGLYDDDAPVILAKAPQLAPEPRVVAEVTEQRFTLAQLVEKLKKRKGHQKSIVESGDPDGPDDSGWDPPATQPGAKGSAFAAEILAYQRRQKR